MRTGAHRKWMCRISRWKTLPFTKYRCSPLGTQSSQILCQCSIRFVNRPTVSEFQCPPAGISSRKVCKGQFTASFNAHTPYSDHCCDGSCQSERNVLRSAAARPSGVSGFKSSWHCQLHCGTTLRSTASTFNIARPRTRQAFIGNLIPLAPFLSDTACKPSSRLFLHFKAFCGRVASGFAHWAFAAVRIKGTHWQELSHTDLQMLGNGAIGNSHPCRDLLSCQTFHMRAEQDELPPATWWKLIGERNAI